MNNPPLQVEVNEILTDPKGHHYTITYHLFASRVIFVASFYHNAYSPLEEKTFSPEVSK